MCESNVHGGYPCTLGKRGMLTHLTTLVRDCHNDASTVDTTEYQRQCLQYGRSTGVRHLGQGHEAGDPFSSVPMRDISLLTPETIEQTEKSIAPPRILSAYA